MYRFEDQTLSFEARAADLVSHLTLEEKIGQLVHDAPAIPRLGIRAWNWWNEASHGVIPAVFQVFKEATSFPTCLAMSQTWNAELIEKVTTVVSDEMRALYNMSGKELDYWCPTVNMGRDPRWGRNDEAFGEDPFLAGKLAAAYVRGIQGQDPTYLKAVSTPKHFAANNSEYNRCRGSSNIDEATLREYYLPVFERCVREAGAYSIMTSYNRVNGVPSSANTHLLRTILREEWGFKGYIVSDDGAVGDVGPNTGLMFGDIRGQFYGKSQEEACGLSLNAGTDICTGHEHGFYLQGAVEQKISAERLVDRALIRAFTARFRLGTFDDPQKVPYHSIGPDNICSEAHAELARKVAAESIVLLKNEGSLLPLQAGKIKKIAVIGPNAIYRQLGSYSIGGNTSIDSDTRVCVPPLAGIQAEAARQGIEVVYAKGWQYANRDWFGGEQQRHPVLLRAAADSGMTVEEYLKARVPACEREFHAKRHVQFMEHFRRDKVPPRFPVADPDIGKPDDVLFAEALQAAAAADVAIVISGTDPSVTREGWDRSTLALPYDQDSKIRQILQANPSTVVVNITSGPSTGDFLDQIPAFLSAIYAGESQGTAIADVLFGRCSPSGRTTQTWFFRDDDMPHISEYGIRPFDTMTEMGRTYLYYLGQVRYPFGYGLSYTNFAYANFRLSQNALSPNDRLKASIDVTNRGNRAGTDVLQLYFRKVALYDNKPLRQLIGFAKVTLAPGETKTVTIDVPVKEFRFWNSWRALFDVEAGEYKVWFGTSSADEAMIAADKVTISGEWLPVLSAVTLLSEHSLLRAGDSCALTLTATLDNAAHLNAAAEPFVLTSSDEQVIQVQNGVARAIGAGSVKLTASLTRGGVTKTDTIGLCVI
jgi:beta-glucosidase